MGGDGGVVGDGELNAGTLVERELIRWYWRNGIREWRNFGAYGMCWNDGLKTT